MVEVGPLESSGALHLLKQRHPEQVASDHIQAVFEHLQEGRFQGGRTGQPVPVLCHLHHEKVFPDVQIDPYVPDCDCCL